MDNVTLYPVEQGSEAWHELRCGRITASRFKDVVAGKSTTTYKGLINECIGQIISGTVEPSYQNEIMQRGIDLEPEAILEYQSVKDVSVSDVGFITNEKYWPEYVGVSPDGLVEGNGLVEVKCPLMKTHISYLLNGKLPNEYKWQVQGQLLIADAEWCDFVSFYPGIKPLIIRVEPDQEIRHELVERLEAAIIEIENGVDRCK